MRRIVLIAGKAFVDENVGKALHALARQTHHAPDRGDAALLMKYRAQDLPARGGKARGSGNPVGGFDETAFELGGQQHDLGQKPGGSGSFSRHGVRPRQSICPWIIDSILSYWTSVTIDPNLSMAIIDSILSY